MVKSSSSCFKIIACGGSDDVDAPEDKPSSDKRGWSFRKRSRRHRVLGNNAGTETPSSAGKETPQSVNSDFQLPVKLTHSEEKPQLPRPVEKSTVVLSAIEHDNESERSPHSDEKAELPRSPEKYTEVLSPIEDDNGSKMSPHSDEKAELPRSVEKYAEVLSPIEDDNESKMSPHSDEKAELPRPLEKYKEVISAIEHDNDLEMSPHSDEKAELPIPLEKYTEVLSDIEHDFESNMSPGVITSENGSSENHTESKISPTVIALENSTHLTPGESNTASVPVVLKNDRNATLSVPKMPDGVVYSEIDGDKKSAAFKIEESMIVSANVDDADADAILDEDTVIVIQAATRGFLARRAFLKLKSAIKLQAAVRGHLVRHNAVVTLHCIRGIVKVQALVRARSSKDKGSKPNDTRFSTVNLLKNSYARQLLESTPKPKSVAVRCDPMTPNSSAWGWLERWMSVSTPEVVQESEPNLVAEDVTHVQETAPEADTEDFPMTRFYSVNSKFIVDELPKEFETEEDHIDQDAGVADSQLTEADENSVQDSVFQEEAEVPSFVRFYSVKSKFVTDEVAESLIVDDVDDVDAIIDPESYDPLLTEDKTTEIALLSTELIPEEVASVIADNALANEIQLPREDSISHEDERPLEREEPKLSLKRSASEELDGEGKKFMYVSSRKASNPAFIAAQSKFEELSLATNPARSVTSSNQDDGATAFEQETFMKTNDPSSIEMSPSSDPKIHIAVSECGTELSISSTLDSPDRSDIGNAEAEKEKKFLDDTFSDPNNSGSANVDADDTLEYIRADLASELAQQKHEINDVETNNVPVSSEDQAHKLSPQATPQSHTTVSESLGTPSSQVSVISKKTNKNESKAKRGSLSLGKSSPTKPSIVSGVRNSAEHFPKDKKKDGKRRNSFGSTKSDNADQEPRSGNPLRSYMQATESAKAKAQSPRSSPDVHDKEVKLKKRHSLPGGRQGSPLIQRSPSQPTESAKANGSTGKL